MNTNKTIAASILGIWLIALVAASGVSSEFWSGPDAHPLQMSPGETRTVSFSLQNMVGDQDLSFTAEVKQGQEIAKITDSNKEYKVPAGTKDVLVNLEVSIPSNTSLGTSFPIKVEFNAHPISADGSALSIGNAFEKDFDVLVGEQKPVESSNHGLLIGLGIAVLIIILIIIVKVNNRK